jgi:micrococcal nuclease
MKMPTLREIILILAGFLAGFYFRGIVFPLDAPPAAGQPERADKNGQKVLDAGADKPAEVATRIIDGDTIVIEGGRRVRLLGIDADEKGYPCYEAAKKRLEDLILGKEITLEASGKDADQYGRLLRYVFLEKENTSVILAREGLAVSLVYPDNERYIDELVAAESAAKNGKIGCKWSGETEKK